MNRSELLTEARCVVEDLRAEHQRSGFRGDDESVWSWMVAVVEQLIELVDDEEPTILGPRSIFTWDQQTGGTS